MKSYRLGLDVGSTTAKAVMVDGGGNICWSKYERHHADVTGIVSLFMHEIKDRFGEVPISLNITGSVGMGLAERFSAPFIQEVVAATEFVKKVHPEISTIIDIGGEDAKIVYLNPAGNADLRMNGNCAGGTGAFIDQMALLLNVDVSELDGLAANAEHIHPIASRCGVFSKTDVQNLISKNVSKADISASIFHAVAVQTVVTLSHGCEVVPKILFCGGPLTFIPALRSAFADYLNLSADDYVLPENANLIPAWGAALSAKDGNTNSPGEILATLNDKGIKGKLRQTAVRLSRIFSGEGEYEEWKLRKNDNCIEQLPLEQHEGDAYLGIDSGSTTTKIVVADEKGRIIFSHYSSNGGNPVASVKKGLSKLLEECSEKGMELKIKSSCSTGYGEDLIKAAFGLNTGVIETIAHYVAAHEINRDVSFILDIGGQDMKAIFIDGGVLNRMEINEACSSGCGSFIETFARSLNYSVSDFSREACLAENPCDLGTRCTVFMNSKVKQVLREGATIGDIAAGLSYSVVKNCLYKVLKLKNTGELGRNIVVQGGTMRNDSVVRALELLTGTEVHRSNMPELMGAYGCALYAGSAAAGEAVSLSELIETAEYSSRHIKCHGCENLCYVQKYIFANGNVYYSGNKCEKVFSNMGNRAEKGRNLSAEKYALLFDRKAPSKDGKITLGIPRALNTYENYPFWHSLFDACGIDTVLSEPSTFDSYEKGVHSVMSDNICFPAKLVYSHIYDLVDKKVGRIFFPYVVLEKAEGKKSVNSYNCPIVSGYSEVVKSAMEPAVPVDSPVINFKDKSLLFKGCKQYLQSLGIAAGTISEAFNKAVAAQIEYEREVKAMNLRAYKESRAGGKLTILLAGRPYHADPLIQHKISDMISDMGANVITEDIVRGDDSVDASKAHIVSQWAYINRITRAAQWVAEQGDDVHFVQLTSFGCGPDAFLLDEVKGILKRYGKSLTLLKIDDVNNIGSLKLRVRSVVESIRFGRNPTSKEPEPFVSTKVYDKKDRKRTLIIPYFTDYISPLIPSIMELAGYNAVPLPPSNTESAEYGLVYANNEVCYPATLIVGDIIKALDSGKHDLANTAVIITQTGGQCRASNYIALIKRAMIEAGFSEVPVLSLAFGRGMVNEQTGFTVNWARILPVTLASILFGDCISKFYHASVVREKSRGDALRLRDHYLEAAKACIAGNSPSSIYKLLGLAAGSFNDILLPGDQPRPKVGIVGEIFLKFNSFSHKHITRWLIEQNIEVVPPILTDFFMQAFVNMKVKARTNIKRLNMPSFVPDAAYALVWSQVKKANRIASQFRYFTPFADIFTSARHGEEVITLSAQFGEGWLLPAEVVSFARQGINNVISLQPFGCIANHIVSKGVEKKIKKLYPQMNLLSLDFDSGVSDVNITNRLLLMTNNLK